VKSENFGPDGMLYVTHLKKQNVYSLDWRVNSRNIEVGIYSTEEDADKAWDEEIIKQLLKFKASKDKRVRSVEDLDKSDPIDGHKVEVKKRYRLLGTGGEKNPYSIKKKVRQYDRFIFNETAPTEYKTSKYLKASLDPRNAAKTPIELERPYKVPDGNKRTAGLTAEAVAVKNNIPNRQSTKILMKYLEGLALAQIIPDGLENYEIRGHTLKRGSTIIKCQFRVPDHILDYLASIPPKDPKKSDSQPLRSVSLAVLASHFYAELFPILSAKLPDYPTAKPAEVVQTLLDCEAIKQNQNIKLDSKWIEFYKHEK
jgi:hypothetical protein